VVQIKLGVHGTHLSNRQEIYATEDQLRDSKAAVKGLPKALHVVPGDEGARDIDLCNHLVGRQEWHEGAKVSRTEVVSANV